MPHHDGVLFGEMIIAHSLIEELGDGRTRTFLALLECPDLELAHADWEALDRFVTRLSEQLGPDCRAVSQLRSPMKEPQPCPER